MSKKLGLYIHIPFCEKKCDYCNFVSYCKNDHEKLLYLQNLLKEISLQGIKYKEYEIDTIFIGGGTPTTMPNGAINKLLMGIYQNFNVLENAEITIECNPNSLTVAKLKEYKKSKINRLSIGLQCYNDNLLKLIGRLHNKKQFDIAFFYAKLFGFKNISVDLILGVPNQKFRHIKKEIKHLLKLGVNHISAYGLIVEDNTKLSENLTLNKYKLPSEKLQLKMYDYVKTKLEKNNINRYEVSNFAKPGLESKHNLKYWTDGEYLGLGVVSSSYVNNMRWKNTDSLQVYNESLQNNIIAIEEQEVLTLAEKVEEALMLGLRLQKGINLNNFKEDFNIDLLKEKQTEINQLLNDNLIVIQNGYLHCTDNGFNVLNQIILQLI